MKLVTASILFVSGVALAFATGAALDNPLVLSLAATLMITLGVVTFFQLRNRGRPLIAFGLMILLLGFIRVALEIEDPAKGWRNVPDDGESVHVTAWLDDDARRAGSGVRLGLRAITVNGQPAGFPFSAFVSGLSDMNETGRSSSGFRYGDVYAFSGRFSVATGEFAEDSAGTVFTGVVSLVAADAGNPLRRGVAGVRERISSNLSKSISEPASSLARTMLVNDRTGLSEELNLDFRESGTSHILAISGLHVALISGLAMVVAAGLVGRRGQYYLLLPLVVTWGYAALAGFSPSVTRAAIMFSVYLLARALGRQNSSLPAIGFAAVVMVAIDPEVLKSVSFQLSFAAISGIAVLTPKIMSGSRRVTTLLRIGDLDETSFISKIVGGLAVSVAATLMTWPLVAVNFGEAPIWGGFATIIILPAVPLLIVFGALSALATTISTQLGEVIGWPAWLLAEFIAGVASFFRDVPPGAIDTSGWSTWIAVLFYAGIFVLFRWDQVWTIALRALDHARSSASVPLSERRFVAAGVPVWIVVVAIAVATIAWSGAITSANNNDLSVTFFQTDRGDMILVRTPNGNSVLIDGGRDPLGAVRRLDDSLPFWDRSLDLLLVTHPDADHLGGLSAVVERYDVNMIAEIPQEHASSVHAAWRRIVDQREDTVTLSPGTLIALDDGVTLEVLSGGRPFIDASINDASVVTMLRYGDFSMLLTGDITSVTERRLLESGHNLNATVLKVPHHGSDTSSTEGFLDAVNPEMAVIQVGTDNRFGHPNDEVIERIGRLVPDQNVFVTAEAGDVTVRTDGTRVTVSSDR